MKTLALLLLLAGCTAAAPTAPPQHMLDVLSVSCDPNFNRPRAVVAVRNSGATTIEYAKGLVSFGGEMHDSYFSPRPLRPGGTASLTTYADFGGSVDCSLVSVTDRDGFSAGLRNIASNLSP